APPATIASLAPLPVRTPPLAPQALAPDPGSSAHGPRSALLPQSALLSQLSPDRLVRKLLLPALLLPPPADPHARTVFPLSPVPALLRSSSSTLPLPSQISATAHRASPSSSPPLLPSLPLPSPASLPASSPGSSAPASPPPAPETTPGSASTLLPLPRLPAPPPPFSSPLPTSPALPTSHFEITASPSPPTPPASPAPPPGCSESNLLPAKKSCLPLRLALSP